MINISQKAANWREARLLLLSVFIFRKGEIRREKISWQFSCLNGTVDVEDYYYFFFTCNGKWQVDM